MVYIYAFICMAFPKAGIVVGGLPLNLSTILLPFVLCFNYKNIIRFSRREKVFFYTFCWFAFTCIIITILNINVAPKIAIAMSLIQLLSPLCIVLGYNSNYENSIKVISISLAIVGGYALLQFLFGIEQTAIYGLNIAYGDSFSSKPIGYGFSNIMDAIKMPATYQNGNAAGLFYVLTIPCIISWKTKDKREVIIKYLSLLLGMIGLMLSGSRSIIIPFIAITPFILKSVKDKLSYKKQLIYHMFLILFIIAFSIYIFISNSDFIQYVYERYIETTFSDATGAGRTTLFESYINILNNMSILEFIKSILIGVSWNKCTWIEGLMYNMQYYGIINFICFNMILIIGIIRLIKKNYLVSLGLICVYIAFVVDSSFNFTPGLINYFWITGFLLKFYLKKNKKEELNL